MAKKKPARITVLEAVDNLSHLADLDGGKKEETAWLDPGKVEANQEAIRETFRTLNAYLQHLYQKEREELTNPQTQKGLQAMMQLAGEAVEKVEKYTKMFKGAKVREEEPIPEFQQLQHFYLSKVFSKVRKEKGEEPWEVEGVERGLEEERKALKDLEAVQQDHEYELFYISQEDGTPFFTPNLLRHIRMVGNFDESLKSPDHEDLFRRIEVITDRDLHISAQEILQEGADLISRFFNEALRYKEQETPAAITKALMALMLSANPKNLMHNTRGKSCGDYFLDFQTYLRKCLETDHYEKWKASAPEKLKPFASLTLKVAHFLCNALFLRSGARHEIINLIRSIVEKRASELPTVWGTLSSIESVIRTELRRLPNGPLLKTLELFRHDAEKVGFDPLLQSNPPGQIFNLSSETLHTTIVHLPGPLHQDLINRAAVVPEFKGYLRSFGSGKHLLINLQDRTSWKDHARAVALEDLSKQVEFAESFKLITLPRNTSFYLQTSEYAERHESKEFCAECVEQIMSGTECGFYYPQEMITRKMTEDLALFIHEELFDSKPSLLRKERLDFIELLYQFLILRIVDAEKPDVISFSCKDGIDTGAAMTAEFYGLTRMLSTNRPWTEEDKNFFIFAFFGPALLVRHRSIATPLFQRALSALDHFEQVIIEKRSKVLTAAARLLPEIPIRQIKITEVA